MARSGSAGAPTRFCGVRDPACGSDDRYLVVRHCDPHRRRFERSRQVGRKRVRATSSGDRRVVGYQSLAAA